MNVVTSGVAAGGTATPQLVASLPASPGRLPIPDGYLIVDPAARRAYELVDASRVQRNVTSKLVVYDLDTLAAVGRIVLPRTLFPTDSGWAGIPFAVDQAGGRLFFPYSDRDLSDVTVGALSGLAGVLVVHEDTGVVDDQQAPPYLLAAGVGRPAGAAWSAVDNRLYVMGRTVLPKPAGSDVESNFMMDGGVASLPSTTIVRWDPERVDQRTGHVDAVRPVRSCAGALPNELIYGRFQATILPSAFEPSVWVACSASAPVRTPLVAPAFQIVRIDRITDPLGPEESFPGPERVRSTFADPGSDRIVARSVASGGEVWWVFDGRRRAWVGSIPTGSAPSSDLAAGLDTANGRLYIHYTTLGRADIRGDTIAAEWFPDVARSGPGLPIAFDPPTNRFFLRAAPDRYDVYRD